MDLFTITITISFRLERRAILSDKKETSFDGSQLNGLLVFLNIQMFQIQRIVIDTPTAMSNSVPSFHSIQRTFLAQLFIACLTYSPIDAPMNSLDSQFCQTSIM